MVIQAHRPTSAKLKNGEVVLVNDHVYVSLPWSERDGTPYIVARIIEFLSPNSTPKKGSRNGSSANEISARLSLYYRPSDISGRNVSDFRLLLAAIHTDVQPLSNLRGKCYVRHRDRIDDLIKWKRLPDHFYFVKFYDPYIKREYEVLRTENVLNIPPKVRGVLLSRYEYLVTEREMVADMTDAFRSCCVCEQWAASQEAVRCESCKKYYHMTCLNPPLLAKPARGYSWVCLTCSIQRHQDVQDEKYRYGATSAPVRVSRNGGKAGDKGGSENGGASKGRADATYRGWPWRYFGLYTRAEDTLDPDDPIFPRAATRVGQKYQATVMSWEEQQAAEAMRRGHGEAEAGPSRHIAVERGHDLGERKHEGTYNIMCQPSRDLELYMEEVAELKLPVPPWDVERLDRAAYLYQALGREEGFDAVRRLRLGDFNPIIFNDKETAIFEAEIERNGGLEVHETAKLLNKRPSDVLRFSYIWKNRKLLAENEALRHHHKVSAAHARQNKTLGAPSLGRIRTSGKDGSPDDDEISLYSESFTGSNKMQCAACSTRISNVWWRCPRTVQGKAMCEGCGSNYRKYGVISFVKAEDSKRPEKRDAQGNSKKGGVGGKGAEGNGTSTPVSVPPVPKLAPCACCRRMEPKAQMARCKTCTFAVHAGCYGIASQDLGPEWECELCANAKAEEALLQPRCVLCPRDNSSIATRHRKKAPHVHDFDILSALKPTEACQWAHVLCSAWMPEVVYTSAAKMKVVEGIASIPRERWEIACTLCNQSDGAVIGCSECNSPVHASCAWIAGYRFGFEFSLAKPGRAREVVTLAKFKEELGVMHPGCWCRTHDLEGRQIYEMHEMDPEQNETALQIYAAAYKSLPPHDESFALFRKATRLDAVMPEEPDEVEMVEECAECGIDVSPMWHDVEGGLTNGMDVDGDEEVKLSLGGGAKRHLCHQCFFRLP